MPVASLALSVKIARPTKSAFRISTLPSLVATSRDPEIMCALHRVVETRLSKPMKAAATNAWWTMTVMEDKVAFLACPQTWNVVWKKVQTTMPAIVIFVLVAIITAEADDVYVLHKTNEKERLPKWTRIKIYCPKESLLLNSTPNVANNPMICRHAQI